MRAITNEEQAEITRRAKFKEEIKTLDLLKEGETLFVEDTDLKHIRSLYSSMHRKGKRFTQIRQVLGYTLTRQAND